MNKYEIIKKIKMTRFIGLPNALKEVLSLLNYGSINYIKNNKQIVFYYKNLDDEIITSILYFDKTQKFLFFTEYHSLAQSNEFYVLFMRGIGLEK